MRLDHVRGLKRDLLGQHFRTRADGRAIALGVANGAHPEDYRLAIRVSSEADRADEAVKAIQDKAGGVVDLRVTGGVTVRPADDSLPRQPVAVGASTAHYRSTAGTLGFFARLLRDGAVGFVSNNHVLACNDKGEDGDDILIPGPADKGRRPLNVTAHLDGAYPRLEGAGLVVDCAFGRLVRNVSFDPLSLGNGERLLPTTAQASEHIEVGKIGRTTRRTHGRVTAFEVDNVEVDYGPQTYVFDRQIEIESIDDTPFSRPGDSGSLIFTAAGLRPLGLLFASSIFGGSGDSGLTYANPIDDVLAQLGVTFIS